MFAGRVPLGCFRWLRLRNVKVGQFAVAGRVHVGEVVRHVNQFFVHNVAGRRANAVRSAWPIKGSHHVGTGYHDHGCMSRGVAPPLPPHVRLLYVDTNILQRCSVDSVVFHSFAWPRSTREAKVIARTLVANYCNWAGVLIVRGPCFSSHTVCFRASRVLENLLWNWPRLGRPYLVYKEGNKGIGGGDPVPGWLDNWYVYRDFCQCHMLGRDALGEARFPQNEVWHYPGTLFSNVLGRHHQLLGGSWRNLHANWPYPEGCNRNTMNAHVATKLSGLVMHVLGDVPPSVPRRNVPLLSVLRSKTREAKQEYLRYIRWRHRRGLIVIWRELTVVGDTRRGR